MLSTLEEPWSGRSVVMLLVPPYILLTQKYMALNNVTYLENLRSATDSKISFTGDSSPQR